MFALCLFLTGSALAARGLLVSGAPVQLPAGTPLAPRSALGIPRAGGAALLPLRAADPAGGPPWGARFVATTRGYGCLQIGRVLRGQVGVIGRDGAFSDDGRFHALPVDYLYGPFPCAPLDANGHAFAGVVIKGAPASGLIEEDDCRAPGRPTPRLSSEPQRPPCPPGDERLLMAGMAGPEAVSVTYADERGGLHTVPTSGPDGAYLIVVADSSFGIEAGEYSPLQGAGGGTIRTIRYSTGYVCRLTGVRAVGEDVCPPIGEHPVSEPHVSAASLAARVSARLREENLPLRYRTRRELMIVVSFRARVAVRNGSSQYTISATAPGRGPRCHYATFGPVDRDVQRGQIVHESIATNGCHGTFRIAVGYRAGGGTDGVPTQLQPDGLPVGRTAITVR
ncbi:MAG TPA: hypothetical protein VHT27_02610 [Solirubrobacteraceae bacterium]|nr:hypothetical protein [Solirubrobacteraceae bacterium]